MLPHVKYAKFQILVQKSGGYEQQNNRSFKMFGKV